MNPKRNRTNYASLRERRFNTLTRRHGSIRAIRRGIQAKRNAQLFGVGR